MNLHAVIMKSNYKELENFIDFAKEHRFKLLALLPIGGNFNNPENIFYHPEKKVLDYIGAIAPRIEAKAVQYDILLENRLPHSQEFSSHLPEKKNFERPLKINKMLCHLPWIQLFIDYDGSIRPDCTCKPEEGAGNVLKDSLVEVWNNKKNLQRYR